MHSRLYPQKIRFCGGGFFPLTVISKDYHFHNFSTSCTVSLLGDFCLGDSVLQQHSRLLKSPTAKHYEVSIDIKTKSKVEMIISPSKYIWGAGFFFLKKLCNKQSQPARLETAICNCIWVPSGFSKCFTHIIRPCHAHILLRKGNWQQVMPDLPSPHTTSFKGFQPKKNIPLYGNDFNFLSLLFHVYSICMHHTD